MNKKNLQNNTILVGVILVTLILSYQYFHSVQVKYLQITNFKACVDAGFKVLPTYPETCAMPGKSFSNPLQKENTPSTTINEVTHLLDYKNLSYVLSGRQVLLQNGVGSVLLENGLQKSSTTISVIGEAFIHDINNDSKDDVVFLLQSSGGTMKKNMYYIASAIQLHNGYTGSNLLYVDTSINGTAFLYKNGEIVLGYTTNVATSTLNEKYYVFKDDILKEITHR